MKDYKDYVRIHRRLVIEAWDKLMLVLIKERIPVSDISILIAKHDLDKINDPDIYVPYNAYYNDPDGYTKMHPAYRKAWHAHQSNNPHHWQYWVILEDIENPKISAIEMEFKYVIEMLCDWYAASTYYGHTARWWWESQRKNMILHPHTILLIEKYIKYLD